MILPSFCFPAPLFGSRSELTRLMINPDTSRSTGSCRDDRFVSDLVVPLCCAGARSRRTGAAAIAAQSNAVDRRRSGPNGGPQLSRLPSGAARWGFQLTLRCCRQAHLLLCPHQRHWRRPRQFRLQLRFRQGRPDPGSGGPCPREEEGLTCSYPAATRQHFAISLAPAAPIARDLWLTGGLRRLARACGRGCIRLCSGEVHT